MEEIKNDYKSKDNEKKARLPISKDVANYVANTGKILKLDDANSDPRFNKEIDISNRFKTKNLLCSPVRDPEGKILGILLITL